MRLIGYLMLAAWCWWWLLPLMGWGSKSDYSYRDGLGSPAFFRHCFGCTALLIIGCILAFGEFR